MKNRDKKKGLERQSKTGNPEETEIIDEKKPLTSNILTLLLFSWNKGKETRQKKQQEHKEGHKKKQNKEGKKTETRKRESESGKEKWMKPRRKKGRHWEVNKNNPFSEIKTVFL